MDIGVSENGVSTPYFSGNVQGEHDDRPLDFWKLGFLAIPENQDGPPTKTSNIASGKLT